MQTSRYAIVFLLGLTPFGSISCGGSDDAEAHGGGSGGNTGGSAGVAGSAGTGGVGGMAGMAGSAGSAGAAGWSGPGGSAGDGGVGGSAGSSGAAGAGGGTQPTGKHVHPFRAVSGGTNQYRVTSASASNSPGPRGFGVQPSALQLIQRDDIPINAYRYFMGPSEVSPAPGQWDFSHLEAALDQLQSIKNAGGKHLYLLVQFTYEMHGKVEDETSPHVRGVADGAGANDGAYPAWWWTEPYFTEYTGAGSSPVYAMATNNNGVSLLRPRYWMDWFKTFCNDMFKALAARHDIAGHPHTRDSPTHPGRPTCRLGSGTGRPPRTTTSSSACEV